MYDFFYLQDRQKAKTSQLISSKNTAPLGIEIIWRNHHRQHSPSHDTLAGFHTGAAKGMRDCTCGRRTGTLGSAAAELRLTFRRAHSKWSSRFLLPLLVKQLSSESKPNALKSKPPAALPTGFTRDEGQAVHSP